MNLLKVDESSFLDVEALAFVRFEQMDQDARAILKFKDGATETLRGDAARNLYPHLHGSDNQFIGDKRPPTAPSSPTLSSVESRKPIRLGNLIIDPPALQLGRNKSWFYRKDENGREYFLAFVNAKGSCSIRTFDVEKGIYLGKHYRSGNYQEQFADLIEGANELTVDSQPNLERDCKERLPEQVLFYLRKQIP